MPDRLPVLRELAARKGETPHQVALAWLLKRSPVIVVISGTRSIAHLEENVAAAALANELTDDELKALAKASPVASEEVRGQ